MGAEGDEAWWVGQGGGGPVWYKHECSLSSLRHRTFLPTFTAALKESRREEEDLGVEKGGVPGWRWRWGAFEEVSGKLREGWGLHPASELIGTALLFYPPTERVVFGRHTSSRPSSSLSRPHCCSREEPPRRSLPQIPTGITR